MLFSRSVMSDSATLWTAACQASLSFTISQSLLKLLSIESVMPSNHLILFHPLLLLPSLFSSIKIFSSELVLHINWLKYWSFSFSITCVNARLIVYPSPYFSSLATISWFSMSVSLFLFYKSVYLYHFFRFHI